MQNLIMAIFSNSCCKIVQCQLLLNRSVIFYSPSDKVYSGQSNIVNNFKSVNFHIFKEIQCSQPLSCCIQVLINVDLMMGADFASSRKSPVQQCSFQCTMPSSLLDWYRFFRETCCLHLYSQITNRMEYIFLKSRSSILNTEAVGSSETLVHTHETTWPCIMDSCYLRIHCVNQNLTSCSN